MLAPTVFHDRRKSQGQVLKPPQVVVVRRVDGDGTGPPPWGPRRRPFRADVRDGSPGEPIVLSPEHSASQKRKLATLSLTYREDQIPLNRLMENLRDKATPIALIPHAAGFANI
jgi:hypothetical protein